MTKKWSDVNAIYQIYPRSFMDSNDDGIGDIQGIISKLDYIKSQPNSLSVDAIWLSPFFPSPMADFGYDVSDYCDVHPMFGTLDDFKKMLDEAHSRQVNVMIDFVPNHSSDEHPWFLDSKSSRDSKMRDYYVWRDPKPDGSPPNNWVSIFGGPAWEFNETTGQYYLHTFLKEQPDLNWDNINVRNEMKQILRFWFEMGVDGIRADAVRWIAKDPDLRDDPRNLAHKEGEDEFGSLLHSNSRYGRDLFRYLRELTDVVAEYDNKIMIFEDYPDEIFNTRDQYLGFYGINPEVSMPFNFQGMWIPWSADEFAKFIGEFQGMLRPEHVPVYCFSNHDQHRLVSRFGENQARLIALMQLTLPGLPVIYYGDELGMKNVEIKPEEVQDPVEIRKPGLNQGRDPERTPMLWSDEQYAGFSNAKPWLPIGDDYKTGNVKYQAQQLDSFFNLYKQLLGLRASSQTLIKGDYKEIVDENSDSFIYERSYEDEIYIVALNFSDHETRILLPRHGEIIIMSQPNGLAELSDHGELQICAYGAVVIKCSP